MNKGFGIVEVMISLVIVVIFLVGMSKIFMTTTKSGTYAENHTYATVLGHTKQLELKSLPNDDAAWSIGWHKDTGNPVSQANKPFYLFWDVKQQGADKAVTVYCAWRDRNPAINFDSASALISSGCAYVTFQGLSS